MQQLAIEQFRQHLIRQERSIATVEKYIRDTRGFLAFIDGKELSKDLTMQYKEALVRSGYAVRSINSMLAAVNSFLEFMNRRECRVKTIKLQKEVYYLVLCTVWNMLWRHGNYADFALGISASASSRGLFAELHRCCVAW